MIRLVKKQQGKKKGMPIRRIASSARLLHFWSPCCEASTMIQRLAHGYMKNCISRLYLNKV